MRILINYDYKFKHYRETFIMRKTFKSLERTLLLVIVSLNLLACQAYAKSGSTFRIVSMAPNWTQTVAELGAKDQLVGVTRFCIFPEDILKLVKNGKLVSVGGFTDISMSKVESLNPDLVLTATGLQLKYHEALTKKNISFIHMEGSSLAETYEKILTLGSFIKRDKKATALVGGIKSKLTELENEYSGLPEVKVYYEINYTYKCVPGADSYITELMRIARAEPVYSDRPGFAPIVSWEEAVAAQPEVILLPWWETAWDEGPHFEGPRIGYGTTTIAEIAQRKDAQLVPAVQTGRVRYINSARTKQAGPQIPMAVKLFAEAIHAPGDLNRLQMDYVPKIMEKQDSRVIESKANNAP